MTDKDAIKLNKKEKKKSKEKRIGKKLLLWQSSISGKGNAVYWYVF